VLDRLALAAVAVPFVVGSLVGAAGPDGGEVVMRFQDPAVVEASGLVALPDGRFVTTNDSGDAGRVFTVDPATGETVGVTTWAEDAEDVEALAPAGPRAVWVGDVGDNAAARDSLTVARVPVGAGARSVDPPAYELVYPDGPHDAESLLAGPGGRLHVATKEVFGGALYVAPARLSQDRPNRLERLGGIVPIATDGAFLPGGEHLVLRDYGRAVVYAYPSLERVGEVDLPDQRQGEAIAVAPDGTAYVTTEGRNAAVLRVALPVPEQEREPDPEQTVPPTTQPTPLSREGEELPQSDRVERPAWPWLVGGGLGVGVVGVLVLSLRRR